MSIQRLLKAAYASPDAWTYMLDAYPSLAMDLAMVAADMAATWYEDAAPTSPYIARPTDAPPLGQLQANTRWSMLQTDAAVALSGSMTRVVFGAARDTTMENVAREGVTWARHASANACSFCRMLATRGAVYSSEQSASQVGGRGKVAAPAVPGVSRHGRRAGGIRLRGLQPLGDKFHDHCHCIAVPVRAGGTYTPPPYVEQWMSQYADATAAVSATGAVPTAKTVSRAWDALIAGTL